MKPKVKSIYAALFGVAIMGASMAASAGPLITGWTFGTGAAQNTGVNNLDYSGESLVVNTVSGTTLNSIDVGVINVTGKNGGVPLALGGGQYTAVFNTTNIGSLTTNSFIFTGGSINIYYNATPTYGTMAGSTYGASSGLLIGSFAVQKTGNPNNGGGFLNPDGTPTANGTISITAVSNMLLSGYWQTGASSPITLAMGFVTSNAHLDPAANGPTPYIDPNLVMALDGLAGVPLNNTNVVPTNMFVQNGGQFTISQVPEPGTIALLGIGLLGLGLGSKKRSAS